jgi:tRNA(His) 5'-end guanylyltransferase
MSNKKDSLGDRMKENYENRSKTYLVRRTPVIIRLDGKAFHTFTRGMKKPYDEIFHNTMNATMKYLCENIQGCKLGYTQSDEITLLLTDYNTLTTSAWFDYNVQKICSVSASMATMAFSKFLSEYTAKFYTSIWDDVIEDWCGSEEDVLYFNTLLDKVDECAMFDSRCFNIPVEEVTNCFIWRQQDATRNAIQMLGQCNFSQKQLQGKSCNDIQDMLMLQKGINFNDMPTEFKRGVCCVKETYRPDPMLGYDEFCPSSTEFSIAIRTRWILDKEIPIFTQDRNYIEKCFKGD